MAGPRRGRKTSNICHNYTIAVGEGQMEGRSWARRSSCASSRRSRSSSACANRPVSPCSSVCWHWMVCAAVYCSSSVVEKSRNCSARSASRKFFWGGLGSQLAKLLEIMVVRCHSGLLYWDRLRGAAAPFFVLFSEYHTLPRETTEGGCSHGVPAHNRPPTCPYYPTSTKGKEGSHGLDRTQGK